MKILIDMNVSPKFADLLNKKRVDKGAILSIDAKKSRLRLLPL